MKKYFYYVSYYKISPENICESFGIGYFSSKAKAYAAVKMLADKEGFDKGQGEFEVTKFAVNFVDGIDIDKETVTLYEVSHEYQDEDGYDIWEIFGVFSTLQEAEICLKKKRALSPYCDYPEGFCIADCKINICGWSEGFTPW